MPWLYYTQVRKDNSLIVETCPGSKHRYPHSCLSKLWHVPQLNKGSVLQKLLEVLVLVQLGGFCSQPIVDTFPNAWFHILKLLVADPLGVDHGQSLVSLLDWKEMVGQLAKWCPSAMAISRCTSGLFMIKGWNRSISKWIIQMHTKKLSPLISSGSVFWSLSRILAVKGILQVDWVLLLGQILSKPHALTPCQPTMATWDSLWLSGSSPRENLMESTGFQLKWSTMGKIRRLALGRCLYVQFTAGAFRKRSTPQAALFEVGLG